MKFKAIVAILAISMLATTLTIVPAKSTPYTLPNTLMHFFYGSYDLMMQDFQSCVLDIVASPVKGSYIGEFQKNPNIVMESYLPAEYYVFDLNNQRWPTGQWALGGHTFNPSDPMDVKAWHFRRGIAYSTDKDSYIAEIEKGMGCKLLTPVPLPLLAEYTNYPDIIAEGYDYPFNPEAEAGEFALAGFIPGAYDNPYYDGSPGSSLKLLKDTTMGKDPMDAIIVYSRIDYPPMLLAGDAIVAQLRKEGIVVDYSPSPESVCREMVIHANAEHKREYNIYTGWWNWPPLVDPDYLYDLYSSAGYVDVPDMFAYNYPGFMNSEYDAYADSVKFSSYLDMASIFMCQKVLAKYAAVVPLWTEYPSFKAYKKGWEHVVNDTVIGDNNWHSFGLMNHPILTSIRYGHIGEPEILNPISSERFCEREVTDNRVYSFLGDRCPYDSEFDIPGVADRLPTTANWPLSDLPDVPAGTGMAITYKIRKDVYFQDGTQLTVDDVKFSLEFARDCGPGVSWLYQYAFPIHHVDTNPATNTVTVCLILKSYWAVHWLRAINILPKAIWLGANIRLGWGYRYPSCWTWLTQDVLAGATVLHVGSTANWQVGDRIAVNWDSVGHVKNITGTAADPQITIDTPLAADHYTGEEVTLDWNRVGVKQYKPWETPHPSVPGLTELIGSGPWIFKGWVAGDHITLERFAATRPGYFRSEAAWLLLLKRQWGDVHGLVNHPGSVHQAEYPYLDWTCDIFEVNAIWKAWSSTPVWPAGITWGKWNEDCDLDTDGKVWVEELYIVGKNFGLTAVWPFASTWPDP